MKRDAAVKLLVKKIKSDFDQSKLKAANKFGFSVTHLNRVINSNHPLPKEVLDYLGLVKCEVEYERKESCD